MVVSCPVIDGPWGVGPKLGRVFGSLLSNGIAASRDSIGEFIRCPLAESAKIVELGGEHFPVRRTPKRGLGQVDIVFEGNEIRGLERNPETKSRWTQLARSHKKVMRFVIEGRYVANVVDGKVHRYGKQASRGKTTHRKV